MSPFDRMVGIEIEVEDFGYDDPTPIDWGSEEDGSLRGGREFITDPTLMSDVPRIVDNFYDEFYRNRWTSSARTSTHVHVDMRDFNLEELRTSLVVYSLLEPAMMQHVGVLREANIYCVPWYRASSDVDIIAAYINSGAAHRTSMLYETCKYSALYLEPLRRFGTIEFRHAPTYLSGDTLKQWVNICHDVATSGIRFNLSQVIDIADNSGINALVDVVTGGKLEGMKAPSEAFDVFYVAELLLPKEYKQGSSSAAWIPNLEVSEIVPDLIGDALRQSQEEEVAGEYYDEYEIDEELE